MNTEEFDHNLCSVKMKANNNIQFFIMANSEGKDIPRKKAAWGCLCKEWLKSLYCIPAIEGGGWCPAHGWNENCLNYKRQVTSMWISFKSPSHLQCQSRWQNISESNNHFLPFVMLWEETLTHFTGRHHILPQDWWKFLGNRWWRVICCLPHCLFWRHWIRINHILSR